MDKTIVIAGASSPFGRAAALKFAEAGAKIALLAGYEETLVELARACSNAGGEVLVVSAASFDAAALAICWEFGGFDLWINIGEQERPRRGAVIDVDDRTPLESLFELVQEQPERKLAA